MAIITNIGHTGFAKQVLNTDSIWLGIGRTTAWDDENNPPAPTPTQSAIEELIGYKRVSEKYLVIEDPAGTINLNGVLYKIVNESDYKTDLPNLVYLKFELIGDELPLQSFRQIGIYFDLVPATGYENNTVLLPDQVSDNGFLITLDNRTVIHRSADMKEVFQFLIQT